MLRIPLRTLLVGTALLVLPAAAQTSVAASLLAGIIFVDEQSTAEPGRPNTTIPEKIQPQENGTTGSGEHEREPERQIGSLGRRPAPAGRRRSRASKTSSGCRHNPHHSPARIARGRSDGEAKVILADVGTEHFRIQSRAARRSCARSRWYDMLIKQHDKSYIVEMEDGSKWRIWPGDLATTLKWTPSAQLAVVEIDDQFCTHALVDQADGTRVRVIAAKEDWSPENVEASLKTEESS